MYESLVAEYLDMELPELTPRRGGIETLPRPGRHNLIHALVGVRRCGKTLYLHQLMRRLVDEGVSRRLMLYFPFDDDRLGTPDEGTAQRVLDAYYAQVPEADAGCYLFLDEVHQMPGWEAFVRRVAERYAVTVVICGSSSKLLSTDIPSRLRGRTLATELWPLDFAEYCAFNGVQVPASGMACTQLQEVRLSHAFEGFLEMGGFPAVQGLGVTTRARVLQGYADEICAKDVLARFGNASLKAGRQFALAALRSTGLKFSVGRQVKSMRAAGVSLSNDAAYALLDDFEDAHLAFKVGEYRLSMRDNPRSAYKLYAVDQGLCVAVAPMGHVGLEKRLQTAVYVELRRRYGMNRGRVVARYGSGSSAKVDFVVGDVLLAAEYELLQVAAAGGAGPEGAGSLATGAELAQQDLLQRWGGQIRALRKAMAQTELTTSTLVTMADEGEVSKGGRTVRIVPAWKWALDL